MAMSTRVIKGGTPDYANLLKDQSGDEGIPFDITFKIIEISVVDDEVKESKVEEVKAHRPILASFSTVFQAMFYGPMKETRDIIPIEGTTVEAFKKMIEFVYNVDVEYNEMGITELFEIVNLAERYNVDKLRVEMKNQMELVPITMENLLEVFAIANQFKHFEAASEVLLLNCAKVFQKNIRGEGDQNRFLLDQHASGMGLQALEFLTWVKTLSVNKSQVKNYRITVKKTPGGGEKRGTCPMCGTVIVMSALVHHCVDCQG